jgi:serine protease Do
VYNTGIKGGYLDMERRQNRFFMIMFSVMLAIVLITASLTTAVMSLRGIGLIQFSDDGTVMFGGHRRAEEVRPAPGPPFTLTVGSTPLKPFEPKEPGEALSFREIYQAAAPSVAVIMSVSQSGRGTGSGIIISEDGYIVTNHHVVEDSRAVNVILHNGLEYTARVVGSDRLSDIAVLKINAEGLPAAEFGDSDMMVPGDPVAAIGNPLGIDLRATITTGVISGINRDITLEDSAGDITMTVLQTNCAVNPGNSGGPLLNQYGQVIGIISAKIMGSASQNVEGLGFAIPSSTAAPLVDQLIEYGYVRGRPAIGITVDLSYNSTVAQSYGLPPGVRITGVNERSDAYAKGLLPNDIITHINDTVITGIGDVNAVRNEHTAGDVLRFTVFRMGETLTLYITLMEEGALRG